MTESSGSVLVVDDNELNRRLATTLLAKKKYTVSTAHNGIDALRAVHTAPPDVILLDVMMPEMDGFECCRRLKLDPGTRDIPVIMVSSNSESFDKIKGLEIGAADYVGKPFDYGELLARVATQVKMKRLLDELARKNALLEEMVKKDSLTNLYNHRHFHECLLRAFNDSLHHAHTMCCAVCDIDHFKAINDTYGHQAGDTILQLLAELFRSLIRTSDIASRYGGEEFAFIFPHTDISRGAAIAETIRARVADTVFHIGDLDMCITISIGVASVPSRAVKTHIELIRRADEALYAAKQTGRNKVVTAQHKDC